MTTLYGAGWRQGTFATGSFDIVLHRKDEAVVETVERWIVVTQDCDLANADIDDDGPRFAVELRPVRTAEPPSDLGIRSRLFLFQRGQPEHLRAEDSRLHLSPCRLAQCTITSTLAPERALALRTWLGLRYDRPAVSPDWVDVMRAITRLIGARRAGGLHVHDVLVQASTSDPPTVDVTAVVEDGPGTAAWKTGARQWLGEIAASLDPELGTVGRIEALTKAEISLALVESSWSADVSQITWGKGAPRGAP